MKYEGLKEYAKEHTIKECAEKYNVSYSAMASCLSRYRILHKSTRRIHGCTNTRLFSIWHGMKKRCYNKKQNTYINYGGRGIGMCSEWRDSFLAFKAWADTNGYRDNLTLDRIDNNVGYCPENCHWLTIKEQQSNRRNNHWITYRGITKTATQWASELGITRQGLLYRLKVYPIETAFHKIKRR